mgnify:CR=1 FL=1
MIITYKINIPFNRAIHNYSISFENIKLTIENENLKELNEVLNNIIHSDLVELSNTIKSTFYQDYHYGVFIVGDFIYDSTHILSPHTYYMMKW